MKITVVIPTYNELENLPKLVAVLFSLPLDLHVLVVDDNSPDGTGAVAEELVRKHVGRVSVLHRTGKQGLRTAYLEGFATALQGEAEAIVQMDADFSHDPSMLAAMSERLSSCDLVLGSRYVNGGSVDRRWPFWRKGLSAFGNFYARTILHLPLRDVTTGYRMWRRETLEGMPLARIKANGYIFLVELAYMAYCLKYKVGEVPIDFADRRWGKSKMSFKISGWGSHTRLAGLMGLPRFEKNGETARVKSTTLEHN